MLYRLTYLLLLVAACAAPAAARTPPAGDEPPAWLRAAAAAPAPAYDKKVPAVVLHSERSMTVGEDGRIVTTTTYAVRVLAREGRTEAVAREIYTTDTGKVRELRAWLIRPSGQVKKYGKDETVDVALDDDDVYNEV
ncbi:MAG TPA: hypothetical protein VD861_15035, partial [Pyrinomonadaceae bacterium]|nr:hypothetical protein [Pyrinomonadaceae bacterium]